MADLIATINRRAYAVGLYWENSPSGKVAMAAKEAARQPGNQAKYYAVRNGVKGGRVPQFGLSPLDAKHKMGMPALAACLANRNPGSWAGVFPVDEGFVFIVVRDDLVAPDGDQLFLEKDAAHDRLMQEISFGGLQRTYAPEAWNIADSDSLPLNILLDNRRDVKLLPVTIPQSWIFMGLGGIAGVILLTAIISSVISLREQQAAEEARKMEELRKAQVEANAKAGVMKEGDYPLPERKWEAQPAMMMFINACYTALTHVPVAVNGWSMGNARCEGGKLTTNWTRTGGPSVPPSILVLDAAGKTASYEVALPKIEPRGREVLLDENEIRSIYLMQNWPFDLTRVAGEPAPRPANFQGEWNPPPAPWDKIPFTIRTPALPGSLGAFFAGLPGVVITSLNLSSGTWSAEGVVYETKHQN